jgi:hypothetical protein
MSSKIDQKKIHKQHHDKVLNDHDHGDLSGRSRSR